MGVVMDCNADNVALTFAGLLKEPDGDLGDEETRAEAVDVISCTAGHVIPTVEIVINVFHSTGEVFRTVKFWGYIRLMIGQ
ncbi:unnamed protein product [Darwinula stevensoni]|uniref:Uncharacterized protein n=1 Tax=Darwinula stevensoni TaxID=69355 RepID=A0A7R9FQP3_9CRUS|nr:unnamed protein product [Darwinula stevensoni]CAG0900112.1 unnamed protein product [Darwinula stevensoni]